MKKLSRNQIILRTGIIGIASNVVLAAFKASVGLLSGSISILLDAVNNLSDALSSVITIFGVKLAARPADRKHPLGYGRVEYLSAMLIAGIVLFAGATSMIESVKKLLSPSPAEYTALTFTVVGISVAAKLLLGRYTKRQGEAASSEALIASGSDALFDAVVTLSTIAGAAASILWRVDLDGWLGIIISAVILRAGFGMLAGTLGDLLGRRVTPKMSRQIKEEIRTVPGVLGVYDLFLDSYGPQKLAGSVHAEVCGTLTADRVSALTREVSARVYRKFGIILTCGIYAVETKDPQVIALRDEITACVLRHPGVLQVHAFYLDRESSLVGFDIVRDFSVRDPDVLLGELTAELTAIHPEYRYHIQPDLDYSD